MEILFKNKDIVLINKPVGVPSQSDTTGDEDAMTITSRKLESMGERSELWLVHRLDRVVGGLIVFARSRNAARELSLLVSQNLINKEYLAVTEGYGEGGVLVDYLYKDTKLGKAFVTNAPRKNVKRAELEYKPLETKRIEDRTVTLVEVKLLTGRFHQIRAQFASRKMSLLGDGKYGNKDNKASAPALFSHRLSFILNGIEYDFKKEPDTELYPWNLFSKENLL